MHLPPGLAGLPWGDLDFLGWRDPGAPDRSYLVAPRGDGLVGVTLRVPQGVRRSFTKTTVCSVCVTGHPGSGVSLLAARRAGVLGRQGNTVGTYLCADLACSLYVRGASGPSSPAGTRRPCRWRSGSPAPCAIWMPSWTRCWRARERSKGE